MSSPHCTVPQFGTQVGQCPVCRRSVKVAEGGWVAPHRQSWWRVCPGTGKRAGFTLVELLVATAVIVVIMAILAVCFQLSIDTMRGMKSVGDMAGQLRGATEAMRRDLRAPHYMPDSTKPNAGRNPSDIPAGQSPAGGFFVIVSPTAINEGADADGLDSTRAADHALHFTSILPGTADEHLYSVQTAQGTFSSPTGEIAYFLADPVTPTTTDGTPTGPPLYNLIRRQRLVAGGAADKGTLTPPGFPRDTEVIATDGTTVFDALDLRVAANRLTRAPLGGLRYGEDVLLSNVISFEVKVKWVSPDPALQPRTIVEPLPNTDDPFDTLDKLPGGTFDSGASPNIRVLAIQVRLRVWDAKLKNARQASFVEGL